MILKKIYYFLHFKNNQYLLILRILLAALISGMLVCSFLQVFARYILQNPISWSEELLTCLFSWVSFLGASYAIYTKGHFSVDLLAQKFPDKLYRAVEGVVWLLFTVFSAVIFLVRVEVTKRNGVQTMNILPISILWGYITVPVAFFTMTSFCLQHVFGFFIDEKEKVKNSLYELAP